MGDWDLLDVLHDAVEVQDEALGASVASGDEASVFVSVEAATIEDARTQAEKIASHALEAVGRPRAVSATFVYDDSGGVAYQKRSS